MARIKLFSKNGAKDKALFVSLLISLDIVKCKEELNLKFIY